MQLQPDLSSSRGIDLVGVKLSDIVRLYLERIDGRSYIACAELVQDTRLVSLRASDADSITAIAGLLRRHGYSLTEQTGIVYVCPSATVHDAEESELAAVSATQSEPLPAPPTSSYAAFGTGDTLVDKLVSLGFEPVGCIDGEKQPRVSFKNASTTHFVDLSEVRKSGIASIFRCRV